MWGCRVNQDEADVTRSVETGRPACFHADAVRPTVVGIVSTILAAQTVGFVLHLMGTPLALKVALFYTIVFGGLVRTVLGASARWGSGSLRADFGWWARRSDLLRAVPVMLLAGMAGALATSWWHGARSSNADWLGSADTASVVVFSAFAVIAAPLFEELVFRGLLQRALTSRYGTRPAILIQGVAFGLYHFNLTGGAANLPTMVYLAAVGCVLGIAAHRWQRLGPTILAHALTNIFVTVALIAR